MTRIAAVLAALLLLATPALAATPTATIPPAGSVVVVVLQSDGLALLPFGTGIVPPLACAP